MAKAYLFNSDKLFSDERERVLAGEVPDQEKVIPLVLRCINVEYVVDNNFMGSPTWRFKVQGRGDKWYRTHYSWALIEDTPENVLRAKHFHAIHEERARLQHKASLVFDAIVKAKVPEQPTLPASALVGKKALVKKPAPTRKLRSLTA